MDLIYADDTKKDIDIFDAYTLDLSYGKMRTTLNSRLIGRRIAVKPDTTYMLKTRNMAELSRR